jgi:hypothetical protein
MSNWDIDLRMTLQDVASRVQQKEMLLVAFIPGDDIFKGQCAVLKTSIPKAMFLEGVAHLGAGVMANFRQGYEHLQRMLEKRINDA